MGDSIKTLEACLARFLVRHEAGAQREKGIEVAILKIVFGQRQQHASVWDSLRDPLFREELTASRESRQQFEERLLFSVGHSLFGLGLSNRESDEEEARGHRQLLQKRQHHAARK